MIEINNNIDSEYSAKIYYKDKFIGECLNELAFLDVRLQIRHERDENYSFELVRRDLETGKEEISERFKLNDAGGFVHPMSFKLYWPSYENFLINIVGF